MTSFHETQSDHSITIDSSVKGEDLKDSVCGAYGSQELPVISVDDIQEIINFTPDDSKTEVWNNPRLIESDQLLPSDSEPNQKLSHLHTYMNVSSTSPRNAYSSHMNLPSEAEVLSSKYANELKNESHNSLYSTVSKDGRVAKECSIKGYEDVSNTVVLPGRSEIQSMPDDSIAPDFLTGSSCSSPPVTPPYWNSGMDSNPPGCIYSLCNINSMVPFVDDLTAIGRLKIMWEVKGNPSIKTVSEAGASFLRSYFSEIRHRTDGYSLRVGDIILLRRSSQEWFDRLPLMMKVETIYMDMPVESNPLCVKLQRYYRMHQVSCMLPDIALNMTNRDAVVFSSDDCIDELTHECTYVGHGIVLSLSEYYRFCAEITRRRNMRTSRRCPLRSNIKERWHDWLHKPDAVFVKCGHYYPETRELETF